MSWRMFIIMMSLGAVMLIGMLIVNLLVYGQPFAPFNLKGLPA